jgi:hypothetical protein
MESDLMDNTLLFVNAILSLEPLLLLSVHRLQTVVGHENYIIFLQFLHSNALRLRIGTMEDKCPECAIGVVRNFLLPLHQCNRGD